MKRNSNHVGRDPLSTSQWNIILNALFWSLCLSLFRPTIDGESLLKSFDTSAYAQEQRAVPSERVAVLTLHNRIDMSYEETSYLTGLVRRVASKRLAQRYLVMTQENIEVLLPPNTKLEDCVSECQVETGRTIGARFIITGEVLRFGSSLRLSLRMHDTKTGQLLASEVAKAKDIEGLESPAEQVVEALIKTIEPQETSPSKQVKSNDAAIIVGAESGYDRSAVEQGRPPKIRSRRERLRERAQRAFEERSARRERQIQAKRAQEEAKRRAKEEAERKQRENSELSGENQRSRINKELYLGLGSGSCDDNGISCKDQGLESDISLALGFRYYFRAANRDKVGWGWRSGVELKYAHSSLSSPMTTDFDIPKQSYTVNHMNLAYLLVYQAGSLHLSANLGFGFSSGLYSFTDFNSTNDQMVEFSFSDALNLNVGASVGFRLTPNWIISVYTDLFNPTGEVELCNDWNGECDKGELREVTQTGIRLSFTL